VSLQRIDLRTGALAWDVHCRELGVDHSKYSHHAYVELRDDRLIVVSQGSGGSFVEV